MPDNAPETQQADSFDDMYNVAVAMIIDISANIWNNM